MSKIKMQLVRGLLLKSVGLGAKAAFILVFVPQLGMGEFAKYFLAFTYSLIVARLLAMGADNYIGFRVRDSLLRSAYYLSASALYSLSALIGIVLSFAVVDQCGLYFLCAALVFALSANSYQTGALRSHSNAFQERRANLPWVLVCVFVLFFGATTANEVLLYLVVSYLIVGFLDVKAVRSLGIRSAFPSVRPILSHAKRWVYWVPIAFSAIGIAASLRSFPIILDLTGYKVGDSLAFNFIMGEIVYQVCMVYVNQVQSGLSRKRRALDLKELFITLLIFAACSLLACISVYALSFVQPNRMIDGLSLNLLLAVSFYCSTVAAFSFVGVFAWGGRSARASVVVLAVQAFSFLCCGLAMLLFGVGATAVLAVGITNFFLVYFVCFYIKRAV